MTTRRRGYSKSVKKTLNGIWSTILLAEVDLTIANQVFDIVEDSDWDATGGRRRATIRGIRGWLHFAHIIDAVDTAYATIGVTDKDTAGAESRPSLVASYVVEDIMWTGGCLFPTNVLASGAGRGNYHADVNVKSMRHISTGQDCRVNFGSLVDNSITVSGVLRAYLTFN